MSNRPVWQRAESFPGVPVGDSVSADIPGGGSVLVSDGRPYGQGVETVLFRADGESILLLGAHLLLDVEKSQRIVADRWEETARHAATSD